MKFMWLKNFIGWINELGTPAVKLLVGGSFVIIIALWLFLKDNYGELKQENKDLKAKLIDLQKSKDTDHILMQDKVDQSVQVQIKVLEKYYEKLSTVEKKVNKIK